MNKKIKHRIFHFRARLVVVLGTVIALLTGCAGVETRAFSAMSTMITVQVTGRNPDRAVDKLQTEAQRLEEMLTHFTDTSEIGVLNASEGETEISEEVYGLLSVARDYSRESNGLFDLTVGALTDLWDITSDNPYVPQPEELNAALDTIGWSKLQLSEREGRFFASLEDGAQVDLGGIAKGYALDRFREILLDSGVSSGMVSIGGNVLLLGDKKGESFTVGLRVPIQGSGDYFCALLLSDTVISTTGGYERFFVAGDGTVYHHVLDPGTGYPADNEIASVSVIEREGARADYLSTRLFVAGLDDALAIMRTEEIEAVILTHSGKVYASSSLQERMPKEFWQDGLTFYFV